MHDIIFYPIGNGDTFLIRLENGKRIAFDFADLHDPEKDDKRMPLAKNFKDDLGWPKRKELDVLAITHGDNDHVKGISETFWLEHAEKYQGDDRIKFTELWVPSALIVEEGSEDDTKILRAEARHRFLEKKGIRVFSRPEHLREWLEKQGKNFDDYAHLITDAGRLVPGWTLDAEGVEFFAHSPFAERDAEKLLDRNDNCLVMQAVFQVEGECTNALLTSDITYEELERIIGITQGHKNEKRLAWDIFKIPHHCSYKSLAEEKGKDKTTPTEKIAWLLAQGAERSVMVCSSWEIPSTTEKEPPHVEAYRAYQDTEKTLDADLVVTMENPSKKAPARTVIEIGKDKATLKKTATTASIAVTSTQSPRMG
jgi:hypothetical protein